jgi:hypothetical protein
MRATGGKSIYGAAVGILMLDARFPRIPGDVGHALTWPFPVLYKVVRDATPVRVVTQRAEGLLGMKAFQGGHEMSLDASLGGVPAYRLAGTEALGRQVAYGTVHRDQMLMLAFHFRDIPRRDQEALEQSVLATFEYR